MINSLWFATIAGMLVLTIALIRSLEIRRYRTMKSAGSALGLGALGKGEHLLYQPVELMRKKRRKLGVVLQGSWRGQNIHIFDLFHPAGATQLSSQTVLMIRFEKSSFPEFAAIERNLNLYNPSVDIPQVENPPAELKKHWLLFARAGRWPFSPQLAEWMEQDRAQAGWLSRQWSFEGAGNSLYVYQRGWMAKATRLSQWLDEAFNKAEEFAERTHALPDDSAEEAIDIGSGQGHTKVKVTFRVNKTWHIGPGDHGA